MSTNGEVQVAPVAAPRMQKPIKRKERSAAKQKFIQQQELIKQQEQQKQLEQQIKMQESEKKLKSGKRNDSCRCCFSSCCRTVDPEANKDRDCSTIDDDATHIASLTGKSAPDTSSRCCGNCCWKKKKRKQKVAADGNNGPRQSRCRRCCRQVTAFIFSHIGLCSLVVAYAIMGGFLFQWLEASDEMLERMSVSKARTNSVLELWNMTSELNVLFEKNWTIMADKILRDFQMNIFKSVKERGWDGREEDNQDMQWSYPGSLLYSVTVITTIGYGHIAPKTDMGRLVTMFYALIGIPLTLLCISNIGSFFANCFRLLYKYTCSCLDWMICPRRKRVARPGSTCTMTTTTSLKSVSSKKSKCVKDSSSEFDESRQALKRDISVVEKGLHNVPQSSKESLRYTAHGGEEGDLIVVTSNDHSRRKSSVSKEVRVPMCVSLLVVALYIFGGAVLFTMWEKDWSYLIGSYFCFITLSTIGFGDYVFGVGSDLDNSEKMITCAIYLVLGLSIIAMCFNLMQEEVRAKCRWLGVKLGIVDPSRSRRKR